MFTTTQRSPAAAKNASQFLAHEARLNRLHRLFKSQINVTEPSMVLEPYLFLGNCISAQDVNRLSKLGIRYVLNVAIRDVEVCPYYSNDMRTLTIDLRDDHRENIVRAFDQAFAFIDDAKRAKSRVLVHCSHGQSRSPAIVIGYLMYTYNVSLEQCLIHVIKARPCVIPNDGFLKQLILFDCFLVERRRRQKQAELMKLIKKESLTEIPIQHHPSGLQQPMQPSHPAALVPSVPGQSVRPSHPAALVSSIPGQPVRPSHPAIFAPSVPGQPVRPSHPAIFVPSVPGQPVRASHPAIFASSVAGQPVRPLHPTLFAPSVPGQPMRPLHPAIFAPSVPGQPVRPSAQAVLVPSAPFQPIRSSPPAQLVPSAPIQPVQPSPSATLVRPQCPAIPASNMTRIQSVDSSSMELSSISSAQPLESSKSMHIIPIQIPLEVPSLDKTEPVPVEKVSTDDAPTVADTNRNDNPSQEEFDATNLFKMSDKIKLEGSSSQYALPSKKFSNREKTKDFNQHPPRLPRSSTTYLDRSHVNGYSRPSFTPSIHPWDISKYYPTNYHASDKYGQKEYIYEVYDKATNRFIPTTCF